MTKAPADTTAIERIANRLEPKLRKRFLAAVQASKDRVDLEALARAIQAGSVTQAEIALRLSEWPERYGDLAIDMRAGFLAGASVAYEMLDGARFQLRFDLVNPYAVSYAQGKLPKIVPAYQAGAREIIRDITARAVSGDYTVRDAAEIIKQHIGLTKQYSDAVENRRKTLAAEGKLTPQQITDRLEQYRKKLLKVRAATIARTEIIQAQVSGQRAMWNEMAREGLLNKQATQRQWVTTFDERTCPRCVELDGQTIAFDGMYTHESSVPEHSLGSQNVFGDLLEGPPLHPKCRCHERLVFASQESLAARERPNG